MYHLRIEQNNIQENVSSSVITKLYELTQTNLDNTSNLQGNLHVNATYQDYVDYLETKYPNLYISSNKIYVRFEDPVAQQIIADQIGDGIGVTLTQMQSYTKAIPGSWFKNQNIEKFNEFALFTSARWESDLVWQNNTYIKEISFPYSPAVTDTRNTIFEGATSLEKVTLTPYITNIGVKAFQGCSKLTTVSNTQNVKIFGSNCFSNCSKLTSIDFSSVTSIGEFAIRGTGLVGDIVFPNTLTYVGSEGVAYNSYITSIDITSPSIQFGFSCFCGNTSLQKFILRCTTVPTLGNTKTFDGNFPIYVVDSLLNDYKAASNWSSIQSRLHGISELNE